MTMLEPDPRVTKEVGSCPSYLLTSPIRGPWIQALHGYSFGIGDIAAWSLLCHSAL